MQLLQNEDSRWGFTSKSERVFPVRLASTPLPFTKTDVLSNAVESGNKHAGSDGWEVNGYGGEHGE